MSKSHILIIEDHQDIQEILRFNLSREGWELSFANDGEAGLRQAKLLKPEMILLDLMLPKIDGLEVCRQLRQDPQMQQVPIIMITAKGAESDVVLGLGMGADDYVVKPFGVKEVIARIKAHLRRRTAESDTSNDSEVVCDGLKIDSARHEVTLAKRPLALTLSEFKLLRALVVAKGRVFTREQLLAKVSGPDVFVVDRNIDVHVASLRKKLGSFGERIMTIRGIGYRFEA